MEPYSEILENLYIGNYESTKLLHASLNLVVNCTKNLPIEFPNTIRIPIDDSPEWNPALMDYLTDSKILETIHTNILKKQKVLVHCMAGAQRSCAVVAIYLIKYYNMTPDKAISFIKSKRSIAFFGHITFIDAMYYFYYS